MGPGDQTQVIRLGGQCLAGLRESFLKNILAVLRGNKREIEGWAEDAEDTSIL